MQDACTAVAVDAVRDEDRDAARADAAVARPREQRQRRRLRRLPASTSRSSAFGSGAGTSRCRARRRPLSPAPSTTFSNHATTRSRTAGVCTCVSSKRNALMMCAFSTSRLAVPEQRRLRVVVGELLRLAAHLVAPAIGSGNDMKPAVPA